MMRRLPLKSMSMKTVPCSMRMSMTSLMFGFDAREYDDVNQDHEHSQYSDVVEDRECHDVL